MASATVYFASSAVQLCSCLILLLGLSIMSHFLTQRTHVRGGNPFTLDGIRNTSWPRICVVALFIDSWLFLFTSMILVYGIGLATSEAACHAVNAVCIGFYTSSKLFVYMFLVERVHVVWSTPSGSYRRFQSKLYMLCLLTVGVYAGIIVFVVWARIAYIRESDRECIIGTKSGASLALLAFDVYITLFLTGLFVFPLLRHRQMNLKLRKATKRAFIGSTVSLVMTVANTIVSTIIQGQYAALCIMLCSLDVIITACALYYVTSPITPPKDNSFEIVYLSLQAPPMPQKSNTGHLFSDDVALDTFGVTKRSAAELESAGEIGDRSSISTIPRAALDMKRNVVRGV